MILVSLVLNPIFAVKLIGQGIFSPIGSYDPVAFGLQAGYSQGIKNHNFGELGVNFYVYDEDDKITYGVHGSLGVATKNGQKDYFVQRIGLNIHVFVIEDLLSLRISPAIEHHVDRETFSGVDVGISSLGLFPYYGYYAPIKGDKRNGGHRIGVRYVFNLSRLPDLSVPGGWAKAGVMEMGVKHNKESIVSTPRDSFWNLTTQDY